MGLKEHFRVRVALLFVGFFGGGILFAVFMKDLGSLAPLAFLPMIFGGAFLLPFAFGRLVPAACPKCGGAALPGRMQVVYACGTCGAESNALQALAEAPPALAPGQVAPNKPPSRSLSVPWGLVAFGLGALGMGAYQAAEPLQLVRDGVSVDARVLAVSSKPGRDRDGKSFTAFSAVIQYPAGATVRTMNHGWSARPREGCGSPCYREGDRLRVRYLPADPSVARIDSPADLFMLPGMFAGVGLVLALVGLFLLRRGPR